MKTNHYNHKKYRGAGNEVQDVMGELPRWMMWRGTLLVILMVALAIVTASVMRYAETIKGAGSVVINHTTDVMTDSPGRSGFLEDSIHLLLDMEVKDKEIRQITRGDKLIVILDKDRTEIKGRIVEVLKDDRCTCNVNILAQCYVPNGKVLKKIEKKRQAGITVILEESSLADKVIRYVSL